MSSSPSSIPTTAAPAATAPPKPFSQGDMFRAFRKQLDTKEYRDAHPIDVSMAAQGIDLKQMATKSVIDQTSIDGSPE